VRIGSCSLAYWLPRSGFVINSASGTRRDTALANASTTNRLVFVASIAHPTTMRLNRSSTAARDTHPSRVGK
jgi:hypothetical protein